MLLWKWYVQQEKETGAAGMDGRDGTEEVRRWMEKTKEERMTNMEVQGCQAHSGVDQGSGDLAAAGQARAASAQSFLASCCWQPCPLGPQTL